MKLEQLLKEHKTLLKKIAQLTTQDESIDYIADYTENKTRVIIHSYKLTVIRDNQTITVKTADKFEAFSIAEKLVLLNKNDFYLTSRFNCV